MNEINDPKVIFLNKISDERGSFTEIVNEEIQNVIGNQYFTQTNLSSSKIGTIRGFHWQKGKFAQGKLVTCVQGKVLDVAINIRKESNDFGRKFSAILDSEHPSLFWIPIGYAHGFQALEDFSKLLYFVTSPFNESSSRSFNPLKDQLNEIWPIKDAILSEKDSNSLSLSESLSEDFF